MSLSLEQRKWLQDMRHEWFQVMGEVNSRRSCESFPPLPRLGLEHVSSARLLPSRQDLLRLLPKHGKVAEIGSDRGDSALEILDLTSPTELHLFDLSFDGLEQRRLLEDSRVFTHTGDSSRQLLELPDRYFDWIYVDGDRSYEGVTLDIESAKQKLAHEGLLVFNDYLYWSYLDQCPYGVPRAVHELCISDGWEFVFVVLQERFYLDVVLRRRVEASEIMDAKFATQG